MKQIITDAFILLLSGAAKLKNGKEVEYVDEHNDPITIEFLGRPNITPNYAIVRGYYENGQLMYENEYQNGERYGLAKEYCEGGQLHCEREYQKDKLHGLLKWYRENGQLWFEKEYQNGERHGLIKQYY